MRPNINHLIKVAKDFEGKPIRQQTQSEKESTIAERNLSNIISKVSKDMQLDKSAMNADISQHEYNPDYIGDNISYDYGEIDTEELRAQLQPKSTKLFNGIGRVAGKTLSEFGKGIGYVAGALPALLEGEVENMTNNFIVNAFQGLDDSVKESLPVYVRDSVKNGSFWRQVWSPEFWATEGADGIGFMLSAILSGAAGGAISKGLGISSKIAETLGKGSKFAAGLDESIIAGTQTFIESAAETKGVVDDMKAYWGSKLQPDGTYKGDDGNNYTQEQVDKMIGEAAINSMSLNMLLLYAPNVIQTKYLFGKGDNLKDIFSKIDTSTIENMKKSLSIIKPWKRGISNATIEGITSAGAEAWQEWSQFAIEQYSDKKGKGISNDDWLTELTDGYIDGLTTIEGQKSIFLGAVLGLGPGAVGAYKKTRAELTQAKKLTSLMETSMSTFSDDLSKIYAKDENGNIKKDKDNKFEIDPKKFFEVLDSVNDDLMDSKLYLAAKADGNPEASRHVLTEMLVKHIYPYLQVENGESILSKHLDELSQFFENDAKDLGFKGKTEYKNFLTQQAKAFQEEYDRVTDLGPRFFGIDKGILIRQNLDKKAIAEKINSFTQAVEFQAVRLGGLRKTYEANLKKLDAQIQSLNNEIVELEETSEKKTRIQKEIQLLESKKKNVQKNLSEIERGQNMLYNKTEVQKAFEKKLRVEKELEDAIDKQISEDEANREWAEQWYNELEKKGYTVRGDNNDFQKSSVFLKDNDGNVFRVVKKDGKFYARNVKDGKEFSVKDARFKDLGLDKTENIMSKEEYENWRKAINVEVRNNKKLDLLKKLIKDQKKQRERKFQSLTEFKDWLDKTTSELNIAKELYQDTPLDSVLEDIIKLEEIRDEIQEEITKLETDLEGLTETIKTLGQIETELRLATQNQEYFSFSKSISDIKTKIEEGNFEIDRQIVNENIKFTEELLVVLKDTRDSLDNLIDSLYERISNIQDIENLIQDTKLSRDLARKLKSRYPDITIDDRALSEISQTELRKLLNDKEFRSQLLEAVQKEKRDLMSTYNVKSQELNSLDKEIKDVNKSLNRLKQNKNLLIKYDKLKINYNTLKVRNEINENIERRKLLTSNQDKTFAKAPIEQTTPPNGIDTLDLGHRKPSPFTSVTGLFKTVDGKPVYNEDGTKVLSDNWKQSARWSKAMVDIDLSDINSYKVEFVKADKLPSFGITAPVEGDSELYIILYKNNEPYMDEEGVIFTGIAHPETYFKEDRTTVDVLRMPEYIKYNDREISEDKPVVFEGETYTSRETLLAAIEESVKNKYSDWRTNVLNTLTEGKEVFSDLTDVSKGEPIYETKATNPKEVFDIDSLTIPNKNTITKKNGTVVDAESGKVYAIDKNGQVHRLLNKKIGDLEDKERGMILNTIIKFIALSKHLDNPQFKTSFTFSGTKSKIPLFGSGSTAGILDYFINWGIINNNPNKSSKYKDYGIAINDLGSGLELVWRHEGKVRKIDIDELFKGGFDSKNVKSYDSPELQTLVDFLDTKFLNVNSNTINKKLPNGFWLPTDWSKKGKDSPKINYRKVSSYNDYVLDNYLETNVKKYDKESDKFPNFVNQYVSFSDELLPELPRVTEKKEEEKETPKDDKKGTNKGGLSSLIKNAPITEEDTFFPKGQTEESMWEQYDTKPESKPEPPVSGDLDEMFKDFKKTPFTEEEEEKKKENCTKNKGGLKKKENSRKANLDDLDI